MFCKDNSLSSKVPSILSGHNRKNKREPPAISAVLFNDERYNPIYNGKQPLTFNDITMVFPLAESTEVQWNKTEYMAFCIKDTTEIAVPRSNNTFSVIAGYRVYANILENGLIDISTVPHRGMSFSLGVALTPFTHVKGQRADGSLTLTLDVERVN